MKVLFGVLLVVVLAGAVLAGVELHHSSTTTTTTTATTVTADFRFLLLVTGDHAQGFTFAATKTIPRAVLEVASSDTGTSSLRSATVALQSTVAHYAPHNIVQSWTADGEVTWFDATLKEWRVSNATPTSVHPAYIVIGTQEGGTQGADTAARVADKAQLQVHGTPIAVSA